MEWVGVVVVIIVVGLYAWSQLAVLTHRRYDRDELTSDREDG